MRRYATGRRRTARSGVSDDPSGRGPWCRCSTASVRTCASSSTRTAGRRGRSRTCSRCSCSMRARSSAEIYTTTYLFPEVIMNDIKTLRLATTPSDGPPRELARASVAGIAPRHARVARPESRPARPSALSTAPGTCPSSSATRAASSRRPTSPAPCSSTSTRSPIRAPRCRTCYPRASEFARSVGRLGIGDRDRVIVYDSRGVVSAAHVWWTFRAFGHDAVAVLDGGLPRWRARVVLLNPARRRPSRAGSPPACAEPRPRPHGRAPEPHDATGSGARRALTRPLLRHRARASRGAPLRPYPREPQSPVR